jgi:hypothetical protein
VDEDTASEGFRVARARLTGRGSLSRRVDWSAVFELTTHSPRGLYMNVKVNDYLTVQFGQFVPAYSLERAYSTYILEVIGRSPLVLSLGYPENIGVMVLSPKPIKKWVSYGASIINGNGYNTLDNNAAKDVTGRLIITPPMLKGFAVGVSGATGEQPQRGTRTRTGIGLQYTRPKFSLGAEHLRESVEERADRVRDGFFLLGAYRIRPKTSRRFFHMVEFGGRYLSLDQSIARAREVQAGGNYYARPNLRVMMNAIVPVDDRDKADNSLFLLRTQVLF